MNDSILLFSGGLDSFVAWHYLNKPKCVYFDIGLNVCQGEKRVIRDLNIPTHIDDSICLSDREEGDSKFIPGRNLYYAMLACKYGSKIYMAGLKDDMVNDKNVEIFEEFSKILTILNNKKIEVLSPFWDMTKSDIVEWYLNNIGDVESLLKTGSCYDLSFGNYCGKCVCCFRKWVALWVNGIYLPFYDQSILEYYRERAEEQIYIQNRNKNILRAIEEYNKRKIYRVDIDGVLTKETVGHDYSSRSPRIESIKKINNLCDLGHIIILWTSRLREDAVVTKEWLRKNKVKYHDLVLGKPQYDFIIDDKTVNLEE